MDIRREELLKLIRGGLTPKALEEQLSNYHENDIAGILEELEQPERERLYRILSAGELADILEYGSAYLGELPLRKRAEVLALMDPDKAVDYLKGLERDERGTLLSLLPEHVTEDILLLWPYEEDEDVYKRQVLSCSSRITESFTILHRRVSSSTCVGSFALFIFEVMAAQMTVGLCLFPISFCIDVYKRQDIADAVDFR